MYSWNKYKISLILILLVFTFFILPGMVWVAEEETIVNYGAWSLVPPLLAITLCILLREALISLLFAVWVGATIINRGNFWSGITKTASTMVERMADSWNATIILFFFNWWAYGNDLFFGR